VRHPVGKSHRHVDGEAQRKISRSSPMTRSSTSMILSDLAERGPSPSSALAAARS
jgi:hypothetical protein